MIHLRCVSIYLHFWLITAAISSGISGCYSFTGAAVPQHWKTLAVPLFDDESNYGEPGLRERMTSAVIQKVQRDNILQLSDRSTSDVVLSGSITSIRADQPIAIDQGDQARRFRIEVTCKVSLLDKVLKKQVWEKQFTATGDYDASSNGASQRQAGLQTAIDKISDDIVLETISGW